VPGFTLGLGVCIDRSLTTAIFCHIVSKGP